MNEIPPLNSALILKRHGLHAEKRFGQNFLQDPIALEKIVKIAEINIDDTVLEIGAGLGALTRYLASTAGRVVAVELDQKLMPVLKSVLVSYPNVDLIPGDILTINLLELNLSFDYLVVANIPYNITSAIIRRLLEADPKPRRLVLTVQKEVAQRICAKPPDMSLLALSVQVYGSPVIATQIPAEAFFPVPKVDSAVVRVDVYPNPLIEIPLLERFFRISKAGFSQKRKTLRNALAAGLHLPAVKVESIFRKVGIDSQRRAETLDLDEWGKLCREGWD